MTGDPINVLRREPLDNGRTTRVFVVGLDLEEVAVIVPNRMVDTPMMFSMIRLMLDRQLETRRIVQEPPE